MSGENLVLRSKYWHARLNVPKDVRHILNRTEFTASLQTGSKAEAQERKSELLQIWKQLIVDARSDRHDRHRKTDQ